MLRDRPLILAAQTRGAGFLKSWLGHSLEELNVVAYFTLINTPKLMVEEGLGLMISFDNLIDLDPNGPLMIKPLAPKLHSATYLIRKKEKVIKINSVGKASNSRLKINLSIITPTKMGEKCGQKTR